MTVVEMDVFTKLAGKSVNMQQLQEILEMVGCNVAFLSLIIHDYSRDKDMSLFKRIYHSLPEENGAIMISEWLLNDEKTGPVPSALMSLNMMVETSGGRNYSFAEICEMLTEVGFKNIEKRPLAGPAEIVIGYK